MPRRALPEHTEQKRREQWRIDESKDELQKIHDVVEVGRQICGSHRQQNAHNGRHSTDPEIVTIGSVAADIALVKIIGEYGVESLYIAGHPEHKRGHESGQSDTEHPRGVKLRHQGREHLIVVIPATCLQRQRVTS